MKNIRTSQTYQIVGIFNSLNRHRNPELRAIPCPNAVWCRLVGAVHQQLNRLQASLHAGRPSVDFVHIIAQEVTVLSSQIATHIIHSLLTGRSESTEALRIKASVLVWVGGVGS